MKKFLLLQILILTVCLTQAQRFFYVEANNSTDKPIKEKLMKASQFVTKSPLMSDYIIKTDINFQTGSNIITLKIILEDSATFKTIFQAEEENAFGVININSQIFLRMAIETFIEKNINQIILSAKNDHSDGLMKFLKPNKDKT